jgi:uncharacterized protein
MAGKFELCKDSQGKYRFRLKASNGLVIAVGEAYECRAAAVNGIDSVRRNAADATLDDQRLSQPARPYSCNRRSHSRDVRRRDCCAGVSLRDVPFAARHAGSRTTMQNGRARTNLDRRRNCIPPTRPPVCRLRSTLVPL